MEKRKRRFTGDLSKADFRRDPRNGEVIDLRHLKLKPEKESENDDRS